MIPCPLCNGIGFKNGQICECIKRKIDGKVTEHGGLPEDMDVLKFFHEIFGTTVNKHKGHE